LRIFLSFHSKDRTLAEALRVGIKWLEPQADFFFSPFRLRADYFDRLQADEPLFKCREHVD
jgi:hypothetical protein